MMTGRRRRRPRRRRRDLVPLIPLLILLSAFLYWSFAAIGDSIHLRGSQQHSIHPQPLPRGNTNAQDTPIHPLPILTSLASNYLNITHRPEISTVPLHATTGTHHINVYVGSPPQKQTLIVDTGSRLMAFPCQPCRSCGNHASPYFDPLKSTTIIERTCDNTCEFSNSKCGRFDNRCFLTQKYTEGSSWTAFEVQDIVGFDSKSVAVVPYTFGCQTMESGLFRRQYADGILGLALHETSIVYSMHASRVIPRNAFSLCFSKTGGSLSVGGTTRVSQHFEPMKYSSISQSHGWYSLIVEQVVVGDLSITEKSSVLDAFQDGKGTILDSGTTDTFLPRGAFITLAQTWKKWSGFDYSNTPRFYSFQEFQRLPTVSVRFAGNVTLSLSPESYMEGVPNSFLDSGASWRGKRELTNRIYADEPRGAVLGANAFHGHDILFDTTRVGIARANCTYHNIETSSSSMIS